MKRYYATAGLNILCGLFGKTRQAFYDQQWRQDNQALKNEIIVKMVREVKQVLPNTGGHKLLVMLKDDLMTHGISIGRDRFFKLLREHGMLVRKTRKYARTTWSNHHYRKWPNLLEQWQPKAPEQLWVSDITYLRMQGRFAYLSLITDAYSHKIVGYHLSQQLKAQGSLIALRKAIASLTTATPQNLIHHSDRGVQYCCSPYVNTLIQHHIKISMTQSGSPYDNAIAERVNGILKNELGLEATFNGYSKAMEATHKAIDLYNRVRPHLSCGYLTPEKAHLTETPLTKAWKLKNREFYVKQQVL